ncbi:hypothetical protein [Leisingera sp. S232]|uniref:hypothetical protein n=1 Tax=Leisingera sp. S232 TaxID=3415132 RepID=UPI00086EA28A|nr:hypothetical protein AB838_05755 [Rhodobacteraceae bacterium (ex Bugula neritina AB1)]
MPVAGGSFKSFSEAGVSFESILYQGMLGGSAAVQSYLMLRRKMFLRSMSQASSAGLELEKFIRAVTVIDQSVALLELLANPDPGTMPENGPISGESDAGEC